ncbi:MAG TPA: ATPase, T2SS/T4P/T4SS family [Clostridia bacterium]
MEKSKARLGDLLIETGLITQSQLETALQKQKLQGKRLGQVLIEEKVISNSQLMQVLSSQLGIEIIELSVSLVDPKVAKMIPENIARRHRVVPVKVVNGSLLLAMHDPLDRIALQDVNLLVQMPVKPSLASIEEINSVIDYVFSHDMASKAADDYTKSNSIEVDSDSLDVNSAPIVRMVNSILETAVRGRASDIHIEPGVERMIVRIRIDGVLQEMLSASIKPHNALVSRIKIMSGLNISEKRLPQDGRVMLVIGGKEIDFRVSTMPTNHGEKIVMRILDRTSFMLGKEQMGLDEHNSEIFSRLVSKPYGIILVTGPTGSGKTTSLYAMLTELNDNSKNIVTLEDPIEYDVEGINQTQINVKSGLTFATGLRAFLRQDPDVIMLGEIRDGETAEIAVRAALTGHMVLSTMHTNNSVSSIARLADM